MSFTIEVVETHPPQNGKKLAKVKTKSGEEFGIWPDKLGTLRVGQRYDVEVAENEFNGRTYRKITKATPASAPAAANGKAAPSASTETFGSNSKGLSDLTLPLESFGAASEEMQFVRELLAAGVHSGGVTFAAADLRTAIAMLRSLWRDMTREGP
jgi:hypothetical protein